MTFSPITKLGPEPKFTAQGPSVTYWINNNGVTYNVDPEMLLRSALEKTSPEPVSLTLCLWGLTSITFGYMKQELAKANERITKLEDLLQEKTKEDPCRSNDELNDEAEA